MKQKSFFLVPALPFRLDLTAWTLRRRPDNLVDRWDGQAYRRVLSLADETVEVIVRQIAPPRAPKLKVVVRCESLPDRPKDEIAPILRRLLGLDVDLEAFNCFSARHEPLNTLARRFEGMRPPRFTSIFEALVNAFACQQLTLTVGIQLLNRLAREYGSQFDPHNDVAYAFPRPRDLVKASETSLRRLGFSRHKGRAIIELASAILDGGLDLESLQNLPDDVAVNRLQTLRGVGRWTAEYALLRGFGRLHVFPGDDVGGRNNLKKWLGVKTPLDFDSTARLLEKWNGFGGLIYFHLLLARLEEAGYLEESSRRKPAAIVP